MCTQKVVHMVSSPLLTINFMWNVYVNHGPYFLLCKLPCCSPCYGFIIGYICTSAYVGFQCSIGLLMVSKTNLQVQEYQLRVFYLNYFRLPCKDVLKLIYLCLRINVLGESRTSMVLHWTEWIYRTCLHWTEWYLFSNFWLWMIFFLFQIANMPFRVFSPTC